MTTRTDDAHDQPESDQAEAAPYCHFRHWSLTQWFLFGLLALAVIYTLYFAKAILLPVAVAVLIAFLLNPIVRKLGHIGSPDWVAAGAVLGTSLVAVFLAAYSLSGPASEWIAEAPENLREIEGKLRAIQGNAMQDIDEVSEEIKKIASIEDEGSASAVVEVRQQQPAMTSFVFNWTGSVLIGTMVAIVLAYFLLAAKQSTRRAMMALASNYSGRRGAVEMAMEIEKSVSVYLLTMTVINICLGVAIGTTMWLLGLPNPVLWGVMAGLLNYAPYIGPSIGAIVVGLVAMVTFDSIWYASLAPLCYLGWNTLEGQFLTPTIMGRYMKISPLAILISIIFWGFVWGPGGVLLAVPMLTAGMIMFRHIRDFVPPPEQEEPAADYSKLEVEHEPALV